MMLKIKDEGIVLEKTNLEFENKSVCNPTCIHVGNITHMNTGRVANTLIFEFQIRFF